jgi:hypothetical protein
MLRKLYPLREYIDFEQERSRLYIHGETLAGSDGKPRGFSWYIRTQVLNEFFREIPYFSKLKTESRRS